MEHFHHLSETFNSKSFEYKSDIYDIPTVTLDTGSLILFFFFFQKGKRKNALQDRIFPEMRAKLIFVFLVGARLFTSSQVNPRLAALWARLHRSRRNFVVKWRRKRRGRCERRPEQPGWCGPKAPPPSTSDALRSSQRTETHRCRGLTKFAASCGSCWKAVSSAAPTALLPRLMPPFRHGTAERRCARPSIAMERPPGPHL